ncbi:MAG: DUF2490 domain-containing protein [Bacteroidia bacterium]
MKKALIASIIILAPLFAFSQESNLGNWLIYFGNKKINQQWNWHHEVQYRNYDAGGDLEQLLLRTGIGRNLSEGNNNLLLGYGYIISQNYIPVLNEKIRVNEHRIYQQFINKHKLGISKLQHRFRLEERWVEGDFRMRFRYFLGFNLPLTNKKLIENTAYLSAYNEIFINLQNQAFDRNRLYGGLGFKVNDLLRFELGYMNQFFRMGGRDQVNMIAFVSF